MDILDAQLPGDRRGVCCRRKSIELEALAAVDLHDLGNVPETLLVVLTDALEPSTELVEALLLNNIRDDLNVWCLGLLTP